MFSNLQPQLHPGVFAFSTVPIEAAIPASAICSFLESEGRSIILPVQEAEQLGFSFTYQSAWITLQVLSDLAAVGLTAKVSTALADAGISCNIVAAYHHDHLFVPIDRADEAMSILKKLS